MEVTYKVRFYVEAMVTVEVKADRKMPFDEVIKKVYDEQWEEIDDVIKRGEAEYFGDIVTVKVDEYDDKGNFVETTDELDIDKILFKQEV